MVTELKKLETVDFTVSLLEDDMNVELRWKNGQLYIAISGILVGVGDNFYEIPIKDIKSIEVLDENPMKLRLTLNDATVTISGRNSERLKAMRHLLLPLVSSGG